MGRSQVVPFIVTFARGGGSTFRVKQSATILIIFFPIMQKTLSYIISGDSLKINVWKNVSVWLKPFRKIKVEKE